MIDAFWVIFAQVELSMCPIALCIFFDAIWCQKNWKISTFWFLQVVHLKLSSLIFLQLYSHSSSFETKEEHFKNFKNYFTIVKAITLWSLVFSSFFHQFHVFYLPLSFRILPFSLNLYPFLHLPLAFPSLALIVFTL